MSTPALPEELRRIADQAPVAHVPADTWTRARAARRRNLAAGVIASAAGVALVAGLAFGVTGDDKTQPPVTDTGTPGVPDRIEAVPADATRLEDDLAVGRSAAAFLTGDGVPVVIDATDGSYHLLDLPGATGGALALSPEGDFLAYATTTGVGVLDLSTGEVSSDVDTSDIYTDPPAATQLGFASDSDIVVWAGATSDSSLSGRVVIGTDEPGPGGSLPDPRAVWAATEQGGFVGVGTERAWFHDGETDWKRPVEAPGTPVAVHAVTPVVIDLRYDGDRYFVYRHDATRDVALALPDLGTTELVVAGWLPNARLLAVDDDGRLLVVAYGDRPSVREVGQVSSGVEQLTLATGLMTGDRLTVPRPAPDWD
jgi:hypothetical protein